MKTLLTTLLISLTFVLTASAQTNGNDDCKVPTVITPNDDGQNDELKIPCLEGSKNDEAELIIFNEWGDRVFQAKPYRNDWRGTYKSTPLPDGTYFYLFRAKQNEDFKKGYVTIFR